MKRKRKKSLETDDKMGGKVKKRIKEINIEREIKKKYLELKKKTPSLDKKNPFISEREYKIWQKILDQEKNQDKNPGFQQ